jgi:hypothetical protein
MRFKISTVFRCQSGSIGNPVRIRDEPIAVFPPLYEATLKPLASQVGKADFRDKSEDLPGDLIQLLGE